LFPVVSICGWYYHAAGHLITDRFSVLWHAADTGTVVAGVYGASESLARIRVVWRGTAISCEAGVVVDRNGP
jgi:hypothetical protein